VGGLGEPVLAAGEQLASSTSAPTKTRLTWALTRGAGQRYVAGSQAPSTSEAAEPAREGDGWADWSEL